VNDQAKVAVDVSVPPISSAAETSPVAAENLPLAAARPRGRWLPAFCAILAVIAAVAALAAPVLRPSLAHLAGVWLGQQSVLARVLASPVEQQLATRSAEVSELTRRLAEADARVDRLAAAQQTTNADLTRALAELPKARAIDETLSRTVDRLSQQADELGSTMASLDARVRAAGLLTLTLRLRRDIDAGLPIGADVAALLATGPYPARSDRALTALKPLADGVPTMRDLADEFDGVTARLKARTDDTSWSARNWSRITSLFGGTGGDPFIQHLRSLAIDGRFNEVAEELSASPDADLAADWVARVHARANAVIAAQVLLDQALAAHQAAYAAQSVGTGGKLTQ
jgi:hypothetical protein